jgi:hypothetical protein
MHTQTPLLTLSSVVVALSVLQDMRAELLSGEQEKELAVMVQDLLKLEQVAKDLAAKLGRTPSDLEWMEAANAQLDAEDVQAALIGFQARLHAGRSAKQVCASVGAGWVVQLFVSARSCFWVLRWRVTLIWLSWFRQVLTDAVVLTVLAAAVCVCVCS